jgi:hypothetical protein
MPMTNRRLACALLTALPQVLACATDSDGGSGGGVAGGGSAAGRTNVAGASVGGSAGGGNSVAGTSAGGSSAGTSNAAGSGGAVSGGASGQLPVGAVSTCLGAGCPYGQCNDSSTTTCSSVYPGEIGPSAPLCKGDGDYCLGVGPVSERKSWSVHCTGTTPTAISCTGNCSYSYIDKTAACPGT